MPEQDAADQRRVAVVAGGAGAIGGAIRRVLEESGHRPVAVDRNGTIPCDLGSESSTRDAAAAVLKQYGRCDVFVQSAAAFFDQVPLEDLGHATTWRHVFAVNVESALWLVQSFAPGMAERGFGRVVFVTSDTLWSPPGPAMLPYVASKGALIGVMRTLAVALGPDGIVGVRGCAWPHRHTRLAHGELRSRLRRRRRASGAQTSTHPRGHSCGGLLSRRPTPERR